MNNEQPINLGGLTIFGNYFFSSKIFLSFLIKPFLIQSSRDKYKMVQRICISKMKNSPAFNMHSKLLNSLKSVPL